MYETILRECNDNNIEVKEKIFKSKAKGLIKGNKIRINKNLAYREKGCILAEELGHHYTSYGNILDLDDIRNKKQEKRARNWAYEKYVGINKLINAFQKGIRTREELIEELGITEEFLLGALEHYKEKYGLYFEIDNYIIMFNPLNIIELRKPL